MGQHKLQVRGIHVGIHHNERLVGGCEVGQRCSHHRFASAALAAEDYQLLHRIASQSLG